MRIWITASVWDNEVYIHTTEPKWDDEEYIGYWWSADGIPACRKYVEWLLIGTKRRLPQYQTMDIIEGDLIFKPKEAQRGKKN